MAGSKRKRGPYRKFERAAHKWHLKPKEKSEFDHGLRFMVGTILRIRHPHLTLEERFTLAEIIDPVWPDRHPLLNLYSDVEEEAKPKFKFERPFHHLLEIWKSLPPEKKNQLARVRGRRVAKTNPGLHPMEKVIRDSVCLSQWHTDIMKKMKMGKSYDEATKIVAKDEGISLSSLRKYLPKGHMPEWPDGHKRAR
jgi:hypothetical protein